MTEQPNCVDSHTPSSSLTDQPNGVDLHRNSCDKCHRKNELHLTNLNPNTTTEEVISYIKIIKKINVLPHEIRVIKLIRKNQDMSKLKFVNFKIECCNRMASLFEEFEFWPDRCHIKPFIRKNVGNLTPIDLAMDTHLNESVNTQNFRKAQMSPKLTRHTTD